jgi:3-phosphoshikimate 1-carboxyvinyltransferase
MIGWSARNMIAIIEGASKLQGQVRAPSSKSYSHRAIIAATLCHQTTRIVSPLECDDVNATLRACRLLGAHAEEKGDELSMTGPVKLRAPHRSIDCGESASTLRFLVPIAALAYGRTVLTGDPQLMKRPVGPLVEALRKLGVNCTSSDGYPPVTVEGKGLPGGVTSLRGDVSSQFVTGLLLAAPLAETETEIRVTTRLESQPYVRLTLDILKKHGIEIEASPSLRRFRVPPKQRYRATTHIVPGDYSSAAFLMAAAALTGSAIVIGNLIPRQPDSSIIPLLSQMGVRVGVGEDKVQIEGGGLRGVEVDARDIPDLVPVIAALGCKASGTTRIIQARRLRYKESDRLGALAQELQKFGAEVSEDAETLTVTAPRVLTGAKVDSHGDHRIGMACSIVGLASQGVTEVSGAECVDKSYPSFFKDLRSLGGRVSVR